MTNKHIIDNILKIISRDTTLTEQFATGLGMTLDEFEVWLDTVKLPDFPKSIHGNLDQTFTAQEPHCSCGSGLFDSKGNCQKCGL